MQVVEVRGQAPARRTNAPEYPKLPYVVGDLIVYLVGKGKRHGYSFGRIVRVCNANYYVVDMFHTVDAEKRVTLGALPTDQLGAEMYVHKTKVVDRFQQKLFADRMQKFVEEKEAKSTEKALAATAAEGTNAEKPKRGRRRKQVETQSSSEPDGDVETITPANQGVVVH